jgi:TonB family protein
MKNPIHTNHPGNARKMARMLLQSFTALLLVASMAIPARAAESRAVKSRTSPVYPEMAKRLRIEGMVKLEATVNPDGKVTAVKVVSGNSMLGLAATQAVNNWKFVPADAESVVDLDINFEMPR